MDRNNNGEKLKYIRSVDNVILIIIYILILASRKMISSQVKRKMSFPKTQFTTNFVLSVLNGSSITEDEIEIFGALSYKYLEYKIKMGNRFTNSNGQ